jgi:hypothetical protein
MNVLFTLVIIGGAAMWLLAVYSRLSSSREQVKQAWKLLEADTSNEAVRHVYNKHVDRYNAALERFPASFIGPAAGFTPARRFES